jgi:hypothetical protein
MAQAHRSSSSALARRERLERLRSHFTLGPPASDAEVAAAVLPAAELGGADSLGLGGAVPAALLDMWAQGSEWHLLPEGHHNVFGFNLFAPHTLRQITTEIFGGEEERNEWAQDHSGDATNYNASVAGHGWAAVASFSEFDYLFCCMDSHSPHFGEVRHMVNNCYEEAVCCNSIDELLSYLADFVEAMAAMRAGRHANTPDESNLTPGLSSLRATILEYGKVDD